MNDILIFSIWINRFWRTEVTYFADNLETGSSKKDFNAYIFLLQSIRNPVALHFNGPSEDFNKAVTVKPRLISLICIKVLVWNDIKVISSENHVKCDICGFGSFQIKLRYHTRRWTLRKKKARYFQWKYLAFCFHFHHKFIVRISNSMKLAANPNETGWIWDGRILLSVTFSSFQ